MIQGSRLEAGSPPTFAPSPASWVSAWTHESLGRCLGDSELPPCWAAQVCVCKEVRHPRSSENLQSSRGKGLKDVCACVHACTRACVQKERLCVEL